jgi:DNA-binding transcriptional regulator PaaX
MDKKKWIALNYNLPTEPSRHRVAAWRNLKKAGAVNIQQSMWVLPFDEHNYSIMQKISQDIEANSGEALLMETFFFSQEHEERVAGIFNNVRNEEYGEFTGECEKYLKELEKEIKIEKFTYAELEEEEEEYQKLASWYEKIKKRDAFNASEGTKAEERLERIKKAFEEFSDLVYSRNNK